MMQVENTSLPGVLLLKPDVHGDSRGYFMEAFQAQRYSDVGIDVDFVQDNVSWSERGVLRGLHYQHPKAQGKLVYVLRGEVYDVAVDLRLDSPTFGHWYGAYLSEENHRQLWIPEGFAHGFCVTSEHALFAYKCTDYYRPQEEHCLLWNDPQLAIQWPVEQPLVSAKDSRGLRLQDCVVFENPTE